MTQQQTALYRLSRLALRNAPALSPHERAELYRTIAAALAEDLPEFAAAALKAASTTEEAEEAVEAIIRHFTPDA